MTEQSPTNHVTDRLTDRLREPAFALVILGALIFLVYCGTLTYGFVWDDHAQIVDNPLIRSWHSLPHVFRADLWYHSSRDQSYYRPLFIVWETLNYSLFALKTWGWHLTTVLLHLGASLSVYFLARKLKLEYWTALLAAAIFGLHPVHIECAAWISAGSDSMVTIFYVLAFVAFITGREPERANRTRWRILSVILATCALFTKEMGLTFFAVVALYECFYSAESSWLRRAYKAALASFPYLAVTIGYMVLRHFAVSRAVKFDPGHGIGEMIVTLPLVLFNYLRLLLYPVGLNGLYYTPYIKNYAWSNFFLPIIVLALTIAAIWYWARRTHDRGIVFAAFWIPLTLGPVLYLRAFSNGDFVRDRYLYLPSVAFAFLLAQAIRLLPSVGAKLRAGSLQAIAAAALCLAFVTGCAAQQVYWANDFLVFSRGYKLSPANEYAALALTGNLISRREYRPAYRLLELEIEKRKDPTPAFMATAYMYLARIYFDSGLHEQGHAALEKSLAYSDESFQSSRGQASLVSLLAEDGDYPAALNMCSKLLADEPDLYTALYNCGIANLQANQESEAEELFRHALEISPGLAPPDYFLGQIMERRGNVAEAEAFYRRAIDIDPRGGPHFALAHLLESAGQLKEAADEYTLELKYNPRDTDAAQRLAALRSKE